MRKIVLFSFVFIVVGLLVSFTFANEESTMNEKIAEEPTNAEIMLPVYRFAEFECQCPDGTLSIMCQWTTNLNPLYPTCFSGHPCDCRY